MTHAVRNPETSLDQIHDELISEHKRLYELMDELKSLKDHVAVFPLLEEFHTLTFEHFSREERAGDLYESIGAYGKEHRKELQLLYNERVLLRSAVRGLLARAKLAGAARMNEIVREVEDVARCFAAHEQREKAFAGKLSGH